MKPIFPARALTVHCRGATPEGIIHHVQASKLVLFPEIYRHRNVLSLDTIHFCTNGMEKVVPAQILGSVLRKAWLLGGRVPYKSNEH